MDDLRDISILTVGTTPIDVESGFESVPVGNEQCRRKSVDSASDGLDELAAAGFDCVVAAYDLPEQTGIEFFNTVRERYGNLPFILYSAEGDEMVGSEAVSAGVTEYVPDAACVEPSELLLDRIKSATGRAQNSPQQRPRRNGRFEAVFQNSQRLIGILNPDGTVRDANQTALEYLNTSCEAVTGTPFWETPWWDEGVRSDVKRWVHTAASGECVEYEANKMQFGDSTRSVSGEIIPVSDVNGVVSELVVIAQDTTDHGRRERELAKTKEQLSFALDAADAGAWEMDLETEELYWDERAQELWGYEPGEFNGTFEEFVEPVHPGDWDRLEAAYQTAIKNRTSYTVEVRVGRGEGSVRWVEAAGQVMTNEDGKPRRLIGLSTDITKRKQHEQQLQRQNDRLNEFASVVSHDLRNPLQVAQGRLDIVRSDVNHEQLSAVMNAQDRMESIIEDTLTLAREGKTIDEINTIQIADLVDMCWASVETGEATLELTDEFTIQGDSDRLSRVFENLFRNSVEHSNGDVAVRVGCAGEDCFYVEDNGPGISAGRRDEVFETGHTSTNGGTGFGLTIVKRIAEAHGWTVTITGGEDGGARFEFDTTGLQSL